MKKDNLAKKISRFAFVGLAGLVGDSIYAENTTVDTSFDTDSQVWVADGTAHRVSYKADLVAGTTFTGTSWIVGGFPISPYVTVQNGLPITNDLWGGYPMSISQFDTSLDSSGELNSNQRLTSNNSGPSDGRVGRIADMSVTIQPQYVANGSQTFNLYGGYTAFSKCCPPGDYWNTDNRTVTAPGIDPNPMYTITVVPNVWADKQRINPNYFTNGSEPRYLGEKDGKVDDADVAAFEACRSGPAIHYVGDCSWADKDGDLDVDQDDFGSFQRCISGTQYADPACGN